MFRVYKVSEVETYKYEYNKEVVLETESEAKATCFIMNKVIELMKEGRLIRVRGTRHVSYESKDGDERVAWYISSAKEDMTSYKE